MRKDLRFVAFVVVLLSALLISGVIFFNIILPGDSFHWDEAHHAIYGVWLARDITNADWDSFWYDTHRQTLWPFFHSWILSLFFIILGASFQAARFSSLVIFFATVVMAYLFSLKLSKEWGWFIGSITCFLMLTSPLMISFSAQNMLEGIGALVFILSAYVYLLSEERKKWYLHVLLGVLLGISVVTKYNYAFLMLASFFMLKLFELYEIYRKRNETR